jgi:hypothetical protein
MADPSPQQQSSQIDRTVGANGDPNGAAADPLAKLHRMSRTAGLGTQEYVAINVAAVLALLLGIASALALVWSLLLIIPLAGVVCGIVALYQIADSNGTQTGRGIAWSGIALSVLFAAVVGGRVILDNLETRSDRAAVVAAVNDFGQKLIATDFKGAYDTLSPRMQQRVPMSDFEGQMKLRYGHPAHGKITSFASTRLVNIETDAETGRRFAQTQAVIHIEHGEPQRPTLLLAFEDGRWLVESWDWFPQRPQAAPMQPGAAP